MNNEALMKKYKKAEQVAKRLGATRIWISDDTFVADFGQSFFGKVEVRADIQYGSVYSVEISGASFHFDTTKKCATFIKNLQNAMKVKEALK